MSGDVTDIAKVRKRRLTPHRESAARPLETRVLSLPYGFEPPSEELLEHMLALPPPGRAELAEILGGKALDLHREQQRQGRGDRRGMGQERGPGERGGRGEGKAAGGAGVTCAS